MDENYTFWLDLDVFRCFKIPNTAKVPEGETTLYTFLGQKRQVDIAAVLAWELPVAAAQSYLQDRVLEFFKQAQVQISTQELRDFLNSLADALADTIAADDARLEKARCWTRELRLKLGQLGVEYAAHRRAAARAVRGRSPSNPPPQRPRPVRSVPRCEHPLPRAYRHRQHWGRA